MFVCHFNRNSLKHIQAYLSLKNAHALSCKKYTVSHKYHAHARNLESSSCTCSGKSPLILSTLLMLVSCQFFSCLESLVHNQEIILLPHESKTPLMNWIECSNAEYFTGLAPFMRVWGIKIRKTT